MEHRTIIDVTLNDVVHALVQSGMIAREPRKNEVVRVYSPPLITQHGRLLQIELED